MDAILELLARVGANGGAAVLVSDAELSGWPAEAVRKLKAQKLLVKASPAASVVCPGCEQECVMPVYTLPAGAGAAASFIVCDKRDDTNRVPVAAERLSQWRCNAADVCGFVVRSLGMHPSNRRANSAELLEIGIATGKKRHQMLCLKADGELTLVAGNNALPLAEFMCYHDGAYSMDSAMIRQLVDSATTTDSRYTPSNARREAHKLDTKTMYESWQKEYRALKKRRPEMSDVWRARQIAGMDMAKDSSAETIRKHMKK